MSNFRHDFYDGFLLLYGFLFNFLDLFLYQWDTLLSANSSWKWVIFIWRSLMRRMEFKLDDERLLCWSAFTTFGWLKNLSLSQRSIRARRTFKKISIAKALSHHSGLSLHKKKGLVPKFSRIGLFKIEVSLTIKHHIYTYIIYINIFEDIHITELPVHVFVTPISVKLSRLFTWCQ